MADSGGRDRKEELVEELWQLIKDSRRLVEETARLSAEVAELRRREGEQYGTEERGQDN
jgi:hypothetical protein